MSCQERPATNGLLELIAWGRGELLKAGIGEAQEECERIAMKLLGCRRSGIYLEPCGQDVSKVRGQFLTIIEKRQQRIPLAYLLQETDFWQETLYVDERCLIPRPETEILVEQVLKAAGKKGFSLLDVGTGSGAIAIAILRARENARATLLDASGEALEVAAKNVERYTLTDRVHLRRGDLFEIFSNSEKWDWIVSNPPYLSQKDLENSQEELRFEPQQALDGGEDGMDLYRRIIRDAGEHLSPGGGLALEVGQGQAAMVSKWLQEAGYASIQRFNDYLGVERVVIARKHF